MLCLGVVCVIRAGRVDWVQTREDLAQAAFPYTGLKPSTFARQRVYAAQGHPEPVSSPGARVLLWDAEQTAAYYAGKPVPALPIVEDDQDLLDRSECAELLSVSARTWDSYRGDARIAPHLVKVKGVEHCPRRVVAGLREGRGATGAPRGRPLGSGDMVPRDEIAQRIGELLDRDPAVTAKTVMEVLGLSKVTATRTLSHLRGRRIADRHGAGPASGEELEETARELGYPRLVHRAAIAYAVTELRGRSVQPYLQQVADRLTAEGLASRQDVAAVHVADDAVAAAVVLAFDAPVAALVWDERWGWRTATSRRHPIGRESGEAPQADGVRYLSRHLQPVPAEIVDALYDGRRGSSLPMR